MNNFDNTIARMKSLYTYGMVNENSNKKDTYTLEFTKKAADGKYYGIVKECNHYYIKQSVEGKQSLAESYNYIGGYMNKNAYQYDSYSNALKNLELKLMSINEACEGNVNVTTLDPFKKENILIEATEDMKNEIARQRQIMYNASMLMNESIGFNNVGVPEAPKGDNDEDKPFTNVAKAELDKDPKLAENAPEKHGEPFGDTDKPEEGKDVKDSDVYSDGKAVAAEHPSGGKVVKVNEEKAIGQDTNLEWGSAGLPDFDDAGVGSPDGHLMEDDEEDAVVDDEVDVVDDEDVVDDVDADDDEDVVDDEDEIVFDDEEDSEDDEVSDDEFNEDDFDLDDEVDESDPEAVRAEIERLQDVLDSLNATEEDDEDSFDEEEIEFADDSDAEEDDAEEDDDDDLQFESKKAIMNRIVESVVKEHLNEDELHVFGDHPGYRKKPMTLPPTGVDKNEHGEDINDESAHSEEPFGTKIGKSSPFDELVKAVEQDVMYQLKTGSAFKEGKKKAE